MYSTQEDAFLGWDLKYIVGGQSLNLVVTLHATSSNAALNRVHKTEFVSAFAPADKACADSSASGSSIKFYGHLIRKDTEEGRRNVEDIFAEGYLWDGRRNVM